MSAAVTPPCSQSSRAAGEAVWGTANDGVTAWLMVEDAGPWGAKVPKQAEGMAPAVRARLLEFDALAHARVQLIRRPQRTAGADGITHVYVGRVDEQGGALWHLALADPSELLSLDPLALPAAAQRVDPPMFFVCTHGTRDACCARQGMPIFLALSERDPERTWQCSHLGGHRFAPTLLVLPHGAVHGRVAVEHAVALADAADRGRLHDLSTLRGRSCYAPAAQAAEVMLRQATGELAVDALRLLACEALDGERWQVAFELAGQRHELELMRERLPLPVSGSCGDAPTPAASYRLVAHRPGTA